MKGRYGGKKNGGWRKYQFDGLRKFPSGCECSCPWVLFGGDSDDPKSARVEADWKSEASPKFKFADPEKPLKNLVVPCDEAFLLKTSRGTRKYKQKLKKETQFEGCYAIEEELAKNKDIEHEPFRDLFPQGIEEPALDDFDSAFLTDVLLSNSQTHFNYTLNYNKLLRKQQEAASKPYGGQTANEVIWEYASFQAQEMQRLEELCAKAGLTPKQLEAVRAVYFDNDDLISNPEVAKHLKISLDSLKDRLKLSLKKIRSVNPIYSYPKRRRDSETAKIWKSSGSEFDGFYRKAHAEPSDVRVTTKGKTITLKPEEFRKRFGTPEEEV